MTRGWRRRHVLIAPLVAATGLAHAAPADAWLTRRWELAFDLDGDPKDFIEFFGGGQVVHTAHHGRRTTGTYVLRGNELRVTFLLPNGKTLAIVYEVANGGRQLKVRLPRAGAVYEPSPR